MSQFTKIADDIGQMNRRIELITIVSSVDSDYGGQTSDSETTTATVWASYEAKETSSGEDVIGGQKDAKMKVNWKIRHRSDVNEKMIVKEDGLYYNILTVIPDSKRCYQLLETEYLGSSWSKT